MQHHEAPTAHAVPLTYRRLRSALAAADAKQPPLNMSVDELRVAIEKAARRYAIAEADAQLVLTPIQVEFWGDIVRRPLRRSLRTGISIDQAERNFERWATGIFSNEIPSDTTQLLDPLVGKLEVIPEIAAVVLNVTEEAYSARAVQYADGFREAAEAIEEVRRDGGRLRGRRIVDRVLKSFAPLLGELPRPEVSAEKAAEALRDLERFATAVHQIGLRQKFDTRTQELLYYSAREEAPYLYLDEELKLEGLKNGSPTAEELEAVEAIFDIRAKIPENNMKKAFGVPFIDAIRLAPDVIGPHKSVLQHELVGPWNERALSQARTFTGLRFTLE